MAIVRSLPGVKVTVYSGGRKLKEYSRKIEVGHAPANNVATRFIKATTDTEFSFKIRVSEPYELDCPELLFSVYVDGRSVGGVLCGEYELIHGKWTKEVDGVKQPTEKRHIVGLQKFRFSEIVRGKFIVPGREYILIVAGNNISSGDDEKERLLARQIGELQIKVHRCCAFYGPRRRPVDGRTDLPAIPEKFLENREVTHGTTHSPIKRILENATMFDVTYIDGEDSPLAVFNFSYRSAECLKQELAQEVIRIGMRHETGSKRKRASDREDELRLLISDSDRASEGAESMKRARVKVRTETVDLIEE